MDWVEGDGIDRVDVRYVVLGRVAMAFEGEVGAVHVLVYLVEDNLNAVWAYLASFSSTY